ncbi:MAG: glutaredoxin family protein [Tractidigestivibacter sp.]|jgi:glutaredoxin 3|uniref:glutaredoxin family protein n=1 Tax=Tractidigestivibacter sp. TaxID=2847320 RepID=UPI003D94E054
MSENKLELYVMTGCPYCRKVQNFMDERGISVPIHNITESAEDNDYLIENGGKRQVPCLFIDGKALYESDDIIAYLDRAFA